MFSFIYFTAAVIDKASCFHTSIKKPFNGVRHLALIDTFVISGHPKANLVEYNQENSDVNRIRKQVDETDIILGGHHSFCLLTL